MVPHLARSTAEPRSNTMTSAGHDLMNSRQRATVKRHERARPKRLSRHAYHDRRCPPSSGSKEVGSYPVRFQRVTVKHRKSRARPLATDMKVAFPGHGVTRGYRYPAAMMMPPFPNRRPCQSHWRASRYSLAETSKPQGWATHGDATSDLASSSARLMDYVGLKASVVGATARLPSKRSHDRVLSLVTKKGRRH
jgi:hypothetical protein